MSEAERELFLELRQGLRIMNRAIERYLGLAEDETRHDRRLARAAVHRVSVGPVAEREKTSAY